MLRSNRDKVYNSKVFGKFYQEEGMKCQLTGECASEQNGGSERKNKIEMEMARSMLKKERPFKYVLGRDSIHYYV